MAIQRQPFWQPFGGALEEDMPGDPSAYVTVGVGSHADTENADCWHAWDRVCREVQMLSTGQDFHQPLVTRNMIQDALEACDRCIVDLRLRRITHANRIFNFRYGGPATYSFEPYPILLPVSNRWGFDIVQGCAGAAYQLPRLQSNRLDEGIIHKDAYAAVEPLLNLKVKIAKLLFQAEVAGEISSEELAALFANFEPQPPVKVPKGAAALADESAATPAADEADQARAGVNIVTWVPTDDEWLIFGAILEQEPNPGPRQWPPEPLVPSTSPSNVASPRSRSTVKTTVR